ncbi:MAG: hypothetical protein K2P78_03305 [Gemmataceae bacterium]|nr:hypothetical protein [Gemmataceae bacterium]
MAISSFSSFSVLPPPPPPPETKAPSPPQPEPKPEPRPEPAAQTLTLKLEPQPASVPPAAAAKPVQPPPVPVSYVPPPAPPAVHHAPEPRPAPGLVRRVVRKWPWVMLTTAAGTGAGYYYHTQQPTPTPHATAEVRTNQPRAEDALRSDRVLARAAASLNPAEFAEPLPVDRVGFLRDHLGVTRKSGSSTVELTFDAPQLDDGPKYLAAVLAAYQADIAARPQPGADRPARIKALEGEIALLEVEKNQALAVAPAAPAGPTVDPKELAALRERVAGGTAKRDELTRSLADLDATIKKIDAVAGKPWAEREAVRVELKLPEPGGKNAAAELATLTKEKETLRSTRGLGPDHPEMRALQARIDRAEREAKETAKNDPLDAHRAALAKKRDAGRDSLDQLATTLTDDEARLRTLEARAAKAPPPMTRPDVSALDARIAELTREREARAEFVKKDEFQTRNQSQYERIRAAEGLKADIEALKERASSNAAAVEAVKKETAGLEVLKERVAGVEAVRKDAAGLEVLKERLAAVTADLKATREDLLKCQAEVEKNRLADMERKASRDAQARHYDDAIKELQKEIQACREKLARLEGPQPAAVPGVPKN